MNEPRQQAPYRRPSPQQQQQQRTRPTQPGQRRSAPVFQDPQSSGSSTAQSKKKYVVVGIAVVVIVVGALLLWNYSRIDGEVSRLTSVEGQDELSDTQVDELLSAVGKHILLPDDEKPFVATITNVVNLRKEQPFYADAENGDKVIVYVKSQKAMIYSPKRDIVVNVGPAYIDNEEDGTVAGEEDTKEINLGE